MKMIIVAIASLICCAGFALIINPKFIFSTLRKYSNSIILYIVAIVVRLILGSVLIIYSGQTLFPGIIKTLGWLSIIASLVILFIGRYRLHSIINWAVNLSPPYARMGGLCGIVFSAFLIYVVF